MLAVFALFAFAATPAYAATGTMDIGGQQNVDLTANQNGTGWTWTAATETLALNSSYNGGSIIFLGSSDVINLVYSGNVTIAVSGNNAIHCGGTLNITGSGGTLSLSSGDYSVLVANNLNITAGTITATTASNFAHGIESEGNISISGNANVTASGTGSGGHGIYAEQGAVNISTTGNVIATGSSRGISAFN
jgi:hypothetical protein